MNDRNKRPETNMWPGFGRSLCGAELQGKQDCRLTLPCSARRPFRMATSQHSQSKASLIGIAAQWWPTSNGHHSDLRAMHPAKVTSQSVCVCVCWLKSSMTSRRSEGSDTFTVKQNRLCGQHCKPDSAESLEAISSFIVKVEKKKSRKVLHKNVNDVDALNARQQTEVWGQVSVAVGNETHAETVISVFKKAFTDTNTSVWKTSHHILLAVWKKTFPGHKTWVLYYPLFYISDSLTSWISTSDGIMHMSSRLKEKKHVWWP